VMDAPTIPVSAEENLRDSINIRVDIIHPELVVVVAFPAAAEELSTLRFRMGMAEVENASLYGKIKTIEAIEMEGEVLFGKWGKLNPRNVGPSNVMEKVGSIAYKLDLPQELSRVHHMFHVSNLKKCYTDEPLVVPLEGLHIDDKLYFVEESVKIMD
ncbi:hypothetical protein Tco_1007604, partial [Tanacetum coccineum]